jgi:8-oxo-dGTP diphosphatase
LINIVDRANPEMSELSQMVIGEFGHRLRIRVSGIIISDNKILLVGHKGMGPKDIFWAPPGGGMEYGSNVEENLRREMIEETNLHIKKTKFLFVHEFLKKPLHAIELFFLIEDFTGELKLGKDPEMEDNQILSQARFFSWEEVKELEEGSIHQAIRQVNSLEELLQYNSYFKF